MPQRRKCSYEILCPEGQRLSYSKCRGSLQCDVYWGTKPGGSDSGCGIMCLAVASVSLSAPQEISGHTSAIKKALWCNNDQQILSAADDKTIRSVHCDTRPHPSYLSLLTVDIATTLFMCVGCGTGAPWRRWKHWPLTRPWAAWST